MINENGELELPPKPRAEDATFEFGGPLGGDYIRWKCTSKEYMDCYTSCRHSVERRGSIFFLSKYAPTPEWIINEAVKQWEEIVDQDWREMAEGELDSAWWSIEEKAGLKRAKKLQAEFVTEAIDEAFTQAEIENGGILEGWTAGGEELRLHRDATEKFQETTDAFKKTHYTTTIWDDPVSESLIARMKKQQEYCEEILKCYKQTGKSTTKPGVAGGLRIVTSLDGSGKGT